MNLALTAVVQYNHHACLYIFICVQQVNLDKVVSLHKEMIKN